MDYQKPKTQNIHEFAYDVEHHAEPLVMEAWRTYLDITLCDVDLETRTLDKYVYKQSPLKS